MHNYLSRFALSRCHLDASHLTSKEAIPLRAISSAPSLLPTMTSRSIEQVLKVEDLAISTTDQTDQDAREQALKQELAGVQNLNEVMEAVITAMSTAKENMNVTFLPHKTKR